MKGRMKGKETEKGRGAIIIRSIWKEGEEYGLKEEG